MQVFKKSISGSAPGGLISLIDILGEIYLRRGIVIILVPTDVIKALLSRLNGEDNKLFLYLIRPRLHSFWHRKQEMHSPASIDEFSVSMALVGHIFLQNLHFRQFFIKENLNNENFDKRANNPPSGQKLRHQNLVSMKDNAKTMIKDTKPINISLEL
ncbi:MAG: hypothetical protein WC614_03845 [bacterium]